MPFLSRAIYWTVVVSISVVVGYCARALSLALIGSGRPVFLDLTMVTLMTVFFTPIVWLVTHSPQFVPSSNAPTMPVFAGYVMLFTIVIVVGRRIAPGFETERYVFLEDLVPNTVEENRQGSKPAPVPPFGFRCARQDTQAYCK